MFTEPLGRTRMIRPPDVPIPAPLGVMVNTTGFEVGSNGKAGFSSAALTIPEDWTGITTAVVGNGAKGVTVTYRPDARSLTKRLPP